MLPCIRTGKIPLTSIVQLQVSPHWYSSIWPGILHVLLNDRMYIQIIFLQLETTNYIAETGRKSLTGLHERPHVQHIRSNNKINACNVILKSQWQTTSAKTGKNEIKIT